MAAGRETDEQLTEYEKQRLSRIRENEARLEALGLRSLAASPLLRNSSPGTAKGKQKKRSVDEDEEYVPSDSGGEEKDESSSESAQDEEVDGEGKSASMSRAKGKKRKLSKSGKSTKNTPTKGSASFAEVVDDDTSLQQAIALSLAEYSEKPVTSLGAETSSTVTRASESTPQKNSKASIQDSAKNKKIKKLGKSRIQLSEDDVVQFFFSFDDKPRGFPQHYISMQHVAGA
uniref:Uncharacterized protein n=1 Tax=Zea mays TaxID=4577 RepID=A0A804UMV3_MAIZE|nr:uncharacterized protein LOC100282842 isoform X1 [Zea mays]